MQLLFFCPRWGSESLSWDEFCNKVKAAGYDGVEAGVPFDNTEKAAMKAALQKYNLQFIGQYWQSFEIDTAEHQQSYLKHLLNMMTLRPVKIDAQTGKDYFTPKENMQLFQIADEFTRETKIPVVHETHRNKALFAAHTTKQYLRQWPSLRITADFSHWCTVAESYLQDQPDAMQLAIAHTDHIHARVGHTEGPQVTDPSLPEWHEALAHHLNWWKQIVLLQQQRGAEVFTITPEFGPEPYMTHHPQTKAPLASQWDTNVWMMQYLKQHLL